MRALTVRLVAIALVAGAAGAAGAHRADAQVATIDPGMTQAQVIEKLGRPLSARSFRTYTYLLYRNGCEKKCGMNDLVTLDSGKVVDAVFRAPGRRYSGTSSSPRAIPAAEASKGKPNAPLDVPAQSTPNTKKPPYVETGL